MADPNGLDGDMTNPQMIDLIAEKVIKTIGKVNLYTADGGFDVEGRENEQERLSIPLIDGEFECGYKVLENDGIMVIKLFTFFTDEMVRILANAASKFQEWTLFKPNSSSMINSEIYFIGIGYTGISKHFDYWFGVIREMSNRIAEDQIKAIDDFFKGKTEPVQMYTTRRLRQQDWL
jgi:23S rRNA U2552 (ribose-2'-O)-methylase RlmE/FtsJ